MPGKDQFWIAGTIPSFSEVQKWEKLVPGTAAQLASELVRSAKHQRMMRWTQFVVVATVRVSACAVALLMAANHAVIFATLPSALAIFGNPLRYLALAKRGRGKGSGPDLSRA
jgi:hypothetical protein